MLAACRVWLALTLPYSDRLRPGCERAGRLAGAWLRQRSPTRRVAAWALAVVGPALLTLAALPLRSSLVLGRFLFSALLLVIATAVVGGPAPEHCSGRARSINRAHRQWCSRWPRAFRWPVRSRRPGVRTDTAHGGGLVPQPGTVGRTGAAGHAARYEQDGEQEPQDAPSGVGVAGRHGDGDADDRQHGDRDQHRASEGPPRRDTGGRGRGDPGPAGRSRRRSLNSPQVRAARARPLRSSNSPASSRAWKCSLRSDRTASRSASEAFICAEG